MSLQEGRGPTSAVLDLKRFRTDAIKTRAIELARRRDEQEKNLLKQWPSILWTIVMLIIGAAGVGAFLTHPGLLGSIPKPFDVFVSWFCYALGYSCLVSVLGRYFLIAASCKQITSSTPLIPPLINLKVFRVRKRKRLERNKEQDQSPSGEPISSISFTSAADNNRWEEYASKNEQTSTSGPHLARGIGILCLFFLVSSSVVIVINGSLRGSFQAAVETGAGLLMHYLGLAPRGVLYLHLIAGRLYPYRVYSRLFRRDTAHHHCQDDD